MQLEGTAVKGIFERSWSWMKAEEYRKEKKNGKQNEKFSKKRNYAEAFGNFIEINLLKFQEAWNVFLKGPGAT